ncbi:hypothetical protein [Asticcacaulis sp. AND118]|uniref:hypothetical protein n=1 Tax=Asticcacaulis sp. AND118 TaxID=2840468 RepID=UPI001CFF9F5E|nr:hypothetical protein [Asticcacaulis sp. AND118]UDF05079.1 hypothetical protein LH365_16950 [Asticcacaulis sp. AND118]
MSTKHSWGDSLIYTTKSHMGQTAIVHLLIATPFGMALFQVPAKNPTPLTKLRSEADLTYRLDLSRSRSDAMTNVQNHPIFKRHWIQTNKADAAKLTYVSSDLIPFIGHAPEVFNKIVADPKAGEMLNALRGETESERLTNKLFRRELAEREAYLSSVQSDPTWGMF